MKLPETIPAERYTKSYCLDELVRIKEELFELQNVFYAAKKYGLLVVLQGMDTAGKDGVVRHACSSMDPFGVNVKSFKKPTEQELLHDFLWRIYPHFPERGKIKIFNRSYYEDVLVPVVHGTINKQEVRRRYALINTLEEHLLASNTLIVKLFLHISQEEQERRIIERREIARKRWKYDKADEQTALQWDAYQDAYKSVLSQCTTVPWQIVPADKRWYRNYRVAQIIHETLAGLKLAYPA